MAKLVEYICPNCGAQLQARQSSVGFEIKCKRCGEPVLVEPVKPPILAGLIVSGLALLTCCGGICGLGMFLSNRGGAPVAVPEKEPEIVPAIQNGQPEPPKTADAAIDPATSAGVQALQPVVDPELAKQAEERKARGELDLVQILIDKQRYDAARRRLKEITEKYPATEAARDAEKKLAVIKDKRAED